MAEALIHRGEVALVTGGSTGIGFEFARLLAHDRYRLILVARDMQRLAEAKEILERQYQTPVVTLAVDLAHPGAAKEIVDVLREQQLPVDTLINNAGFGAYGPFAELEPQTQIDMIQTNVGALTELTRLLLPDMLGRQFGRVLNVASTAAFQPGPMMAVYYATKAYVLSFSEALYNETEGTGVSVTCLCPGPTYTGFQSRAKLPASPVRLSKLASLSAQNVAEIGYHGMLRSERLVIPGLPNKLTVLAAKFSPRGTILRAVRWVQDSKRK